MKVPTRKRDQWSLNGDHTHFIIIREQPIGMGSRKDPVRKSPYDVTGENQLEKLTDSAQSATNQFREQFEKFLYQGTLQSTTETTSPANSLPPKTTTGIEENLFENELIVILL